MATVNNDLHDLRHYLSVEFDMDSDDVAEMLEIFFESIGGLIGDAETSLQLGSLEDISSIGHTIKGSAANVGASSISRLALALETAAQNNNISECGELLSRIRDSFDKLHSEYKT